MQTHCTRLDLCHRLLTSLAQSMTRVCLEPAPRTHIDRLRAFVVPIIANAWVAAVGQPSPMTGFALVVMAELGGILLRLPAIQAVLATAAKSIAFALAALTFQLAATWQARIAAISAVPAALGARHPPFDFQILCNVKQPLVRAGYHSASGRPQSNTQQLPRRTS